MLGTDGVVHGWGQYAPLNTVIKVQASFYEGSSEAVSDHSFSSLHISLELSFIQPLFAHLEDPSQQPWLMMSYLPW